MQERTGEPSLLKKNIVRIGMSPGNPTVTRGTSPTTIRIDPIMKKPTIKNGRTARTPTAITTTTTKSTSTSPTHNNSLTPKKEMRRFQIINK